MLSISEKFLCEDLDAIKAELLLEAPSKLNKKFRRMMYKYGTQLPGKKQSANKRRQMSKTPGFKEAKVQFEKKSDFQKDRWELRDALQYMIAENPKYSKILYKYNNRQFANGLREINKVRKDSSMTKRKRHGKISEIMKKIRKYHVFRPGSLSITEYLKAWDSAYGTTTRKDRKYIHKNFVSGIKSIMKGVKYFK